MTTTIDQFIDRTAPAITELRRGPVGACGNVNDPAADEFDETRSPKPPSDAA